MSEIETDFEEEEVSPAIDSFAPVSRITDSLSEATGLLVVDVSNLAYRSAYAYSELKTASGRFAGHVYGSARLLLSTLKNHVPPGNWNIVFCYDGKDAKAARQAIMPEYKSNRSHDRFNPLPDVNEVIGFIPGIHIESTVREGDDAIAWAVEHLGSLKRPAVVLSGDRDLWTLMRFPWCQVFSPNLKRIVNPADIRKVYHVDEPVRVTFAKALFGDSSDGIKSVDRLLKKHVEPHLNAMEVNSLSSFMELVEAAEPKTTSLNTKQKLRDAQSQILTNLSVIAADITGFNASNVKKVLATPSNRESLCAGLSFYECKTMVSRVDEFFGAEFYVEHSHDE